MNIKINKEGCRVCIYVQLYAPGEMAPEEAVSGEVNTPPVREIMLGTLPVSSIFIFIFQLFYGN